MRKHHLYPCREIFPNLFFYLNFDYQTSSKNKFWNAQRKSGEGYLAPLFPNISETTTCSYGDEALQRIVLVKVFFFLSGNKMYMVTPYLYQEQQRNDITYLVNVAQDNIQL